MSTPWLPQGRPLGVVNEDGSPIAGGGGGGGAPGYADATTPSPAFAPLVAFLDGSGVVHVVTDTDPLPVVGGSGGGGGLTDVQLRATPVPVDGSGATQPVSGTFWQATQPVSGPLTDAQLRAADVPVGLNAASLAALETIQIGSLPAVALDVATLAALESITVQNGAGAAAVNIQDGGNSITVDGTFWQATQPVSLATNTPDVTDRDARLLGRAKLLDSAGAVIDPALKGQLPAALAAGGGLKVEGVAGGVAQPVSGTFWQATQPVSGSVTADTELPAAAALSDTLANPTAPMVGAGLLTWDGTQFVRTRGDVANGLDVDVTRLPALPAGNNNIGDVDVLTLPALAAGAAEIGKVQISDGTDVATVLPVRTQPATTEKALMVMDLPRRLPTYGFTTGEIAAAITIGVKELCTVFSPAAVTQDIYIVEITVTTLVTTASTTGGRTTVRVAKTAAVGTGGTNITVADLSGAGADPITGNAAANVMQAKTGGAADGTVVIRRGWEHATQPLGVVSQSIFLASNPGDGMLLRGGVADGINVSLERVVAHTALVDQTTVNIRYLSL